MATSSSVKIVDIKVETYKMTNHFSKINNIDEANVQVVVDTTFSDVSEEEKDFVKLDLALDINIITPDNEILTALQMNQISIFTHDSKDKNVEEFINDFGLNMISISYPYARSFVSSVTALAGITPIELPAINVIDLVTNGENKKKS